jgi:hypothetical protein
MDHGTERVDAATDDQRRDFLRLLPLRQEALTWAIEEGEGSELGRAAADLRDAAKAVGAASLADVCARLEGRARDGLLGDRAALAVELVRACAAVGELLAVGAAR